MMASDRFKGDWTEKDTGTVWWIAKYTRWKALRCYVCFVHCFNAKSEFSVSKPGRDSVLKMAAQFLLCLLSSHT